MIPNEVLVSCKSVVHAIAIAALPPEQREVLILPSKPEVRFRAGDLTRRFVSAIDDVRCACAMLTLFPEAVSRVRARAKFFSDYFQAARRRRLVGAIASRSRTTAASAAFTAASLPNCS
ncbi:MAG TPA: hypothetical protein VMJ10_29675 [Kofleriaceae bacterium]|nr:hypothetical protein [Kofleriaceae bacterium]